MREKTNIIEIDRFEVREREREREKERERGREGAYAVKMVIGQKLQDKHCTQAMRAGGHKNVKKFFQAKISGYSV